MPGLETASIESINAYGMQLMRQKRAYPLNLSLVEALLHFCEDGNDTRIEYVDQIRQLVCQRKKCRDHFIKNIKTEGRASAQIECRHRDAV